jgi:hypothetical protein
VKSAHCFRLSSWFIPTLVAAGLASQAKSDSLFVDGPFSFWKPSNGELNFKLPALNLVYRRVGTQLPTGTGAFPFGYSIVMELEGAPVGQAGSSLDRMGVTVRGTADRQSVYAEAIVLGAKTSPEDYMIGPGTAFFPPALSPSGTEGSPKSEQGCITGGFHPLSTQFGFLIGCEVVSKGLTRVKTVSGFDFEEFGVFLPSEALFIGVGYELGVTTFHNVRLADLPAPKSTGRVIEYRNTAEFPGSPGGQFFYTADVNEAAFVDSGGAGRYVRTGKSFNAGGFARSCRFYGSQRPGPNSHFYTVSESGCEELRGLAKSPIPSDAQQWNFEGYSFATGVPRANADGTKSCSTGTVPVYRAYNRAFPDSGPRNAWDSNHRFSTNKADIDEVVALGWKDEGVAMCAPA